MKKLTRGQWLCAAAAALLMILAVLAYFADATVKAETAQLISSHKSGVGQLTEEAVVRQTFRAGQDGLAAVDVMFSNYSKKVHEGTLTLWLTDPDGRELAREDYAVVALKNSAFVTLPLASVQAGSQGKIYTLHAVSDCMEQKGVTLRMGPVGMPEEGVALTLADGTVTTESALNLRFRYETLSYSVMGAGTLALIALCFAACMPLAKGKERRHDKA